jgi:hypothetical protein
VSTTNSNPRVVDVKRVPATSAAPKPNVSTLRPFALATSIRLRPNVSSALITLARSPGHVNSCAFAAP